MLQPKRHEMKLPLMFTAFEPLLSALATVTFYTTAFVVPPFMTRARQVPSRQIASPAHQSLDLVQIMQLQRKSGMADRTAASDVVDERQLWAVPAPRHWGRKPDLRCRYCMHAWFEPKPTFTLRSEVCCRQTRESIVQQFAPFLEIGRWLFYFCSNRTWQSAIRAHLWAGFPNFLTSRRILQ